MPALQYGEKKSSKRGRSVAFHDAEMMSASSLDSVVNLMSNIVLKDESRGDEPDKRRLEGSSKKKRLEPHGTDEIIRLAVDTIQELNPTLSEPENSCPGWPSQLDHFSVPEWFFFESGLDGNSLTEMNTFSDIFKPALDMFDGEFMWWGVPFSDKELVNTASSKPPANITFVLAGDSRDKRVSKEAGLSGSGSSCSDQQILDKFRRMAV